MYETGRREETITLEAGGEPVTLSYMNTHKVIMLTKTPGKYSVKYYVVDREEKEDVAHELLFSQVITIGCGFGLMFLAFCFFEGKNCFRAIGAYLKNCRGKSSSKDPVIENVDTDEDNLSNENDSEGNIAMGGKVNDQSLGPAIISEDAGFDS